MDAVVRKHGEGLPRPLSVGGNDTMKTPEHDPQGLSEILSQQAWQWLRLLHSGSAGAQDAHDFRQWVRSSPAHQAAYNEAKLRWDALKQCAGDLLQAQPELVTGHERGLRERLRTRRAFLGAAGATAAMATVAVNYSPWGLWPTTGEWVADYRTGAGEQRSVVLNAHVHLTLNTRTSVSQQMDAGKAVGLHLVNGEVAVNVATGEQPFAVRAGVGRTVADAGQFEVRNLDHKVCVTCLTGSVRVSHPAGSRNLGPRQQAVYDASAISGVSAVDQSAVSSWRRGVLVFKQTRLGDALEEINRYRPGRVVLMNAAAREKSVTGQFVIASLDLALTQLQHVFALRARSLPGGLLLLS